MPESSILAKLFSGLPDGIAVSFMLLEHKDAVRVRVFDMDSKPMNELSVCFARRDMIHRIDADEMLRHNIEHAVRLVMKARAE